MNSNALPIAIAVSETCGIAWPDLISRHRCKSLNFARRCVAGILYDVLGLSYPEVARIMGRMNHSTAHHMAGLYRAMPADERLAIENAVPQLVAWKAKRYGRTTPQEVPTTSLSLYVERANRARASGMGGGDGVLPQEPARFDFRRPGAGGRAKGIGESPCRTRRNPIWESTGVWHA